MPTVCFCNGNIPWGGGETWHLNAAVSLADRGWKVLLLCHPEGELYRKALRHNVIEVVPMRIGRASFLNPFLLSKLKRFFIDRRVDALIMNLPSDLKAAAPMARAAGIRHVIYRRGSALPVRDTRLNRRLYGQAITQLIVNSKATRQQVLKNNPHLIPEDRITILPNGFDLAKLDAALTKSSPLPGLKGRYVIGNAGRLNRQKGQHLLLHLADRLVRAGLDAVILIAGAGEREAELKELAHRLGLGDRLVFAGFMEDLAPFWRSIDLFVLSSLWEGFGNVVIEAMLAKKPVFAFKVSNIPELVTEGPDGNGRLFPLPPEELANSPDSIRDNADTGSPAASDRHPLDLMADAVLELAARPKQAKRMGAAGRRFAEGFSQEKCMDRLEELLRS